MYKISNENEICQSGKENIEMSCYKNVIIKCYYKCYCNVIECYYKWLLLNVINKKKFPSYRIVNHVNKGKIGGKKFYVGIDLTHRSGS